MTYFVKGSYNIIMVNLLNNLGGKKMLNINTNESQVNKFNYLTLPQNLGF